MVSKVNGKNVSIFAGDMSQGSFLPMQKPTEDRKGLFGKSQKTESRVELVRNEVKRKAREVMKQQFDKDSRNYFDVADESLGRLEEATAEVRKNNTEISGLRESEKAMREEWGIKEDDLEHQEVELMREIYAKLGPRAAKDGRSYRDRITAELDRYAAYSRGESEILPNWAKHFSPEELAMAVNITGKPYTFYQEVCLANGSMDEHYGSFIDQAQEEIADASADLHAAQKGPLLTESMEMAYEAKEQIEAAGAKQIIGILREEAQNYVKEELEKEVEAAKEAAEEKKAEEEKAAEQKAEEEKAEKAESGEGNTEGVEKQLEETAEAMKSEDDFAQVQAKISQILSETKLLDEDQKGILVDQVL